MFPKFTKWIRKFLADPTADRDLPHVHGIRLSDVDAETVRLAARDHFIGANPGDVSASAIRETIAATEAVRNELWGRKLPGPYAPPTGHGDRQEEWKFNDFTPDELMELADLLDILVYQDIAGKDQSGVVKKITAIVNARETRLEFEDQLANYRIATQSDSRPGR